MYAIELSNTRVVPDISFDSIPGDIDPGDCNIFLGCSGPVCENNQTEAQWWWALTGFLVVGMCVVTCAKLFRLLIKTFQAGKLDRRDSTSQCLVCCTVGECVGAIYWFDLMWRRPFTCALGTTEIAQLFAEIIPAACLAMFAILATIALILMWCDELRIIQGVTVVQSNYVVGDQTMCCLHVSRVGLAYTSVPRICSRRRPRTRRSRSSSCFFRGLHFFLVRVII